MQTDSTPINVGPPPPVYSAYPGPGEKTEQQPGVAYQGPSYLTHNQQYPPPNQPYAPQPQGGQYQTPYAPQYPAPAGGVSAPQPSYAQQPQINTTTTTVVMQQPTVVRQPVFRDMPVTMICNHCHATITTSTDFVSGACAWLACLGLFFIGCSGGCCLIPFCVDGCKDVEHRCPNCQKIVGRYGRL